MKVTSEFLRSHKDHIFVFGDNLLRKGYAGGAKLRDEKNSYGFVTKKYPSSIDSSFYRVEDYKPVFKLELEKLVCFITNNPDKVFLISKIGSGLANRFGIYEEIIEPGIKEKLKQYLNVKFLF